MLTQSLVPGAHVSYKTREEVRVRERLRKIQAAKRRIAAESARASQPIERVVNNLPFDPG
jgi:hypothetical protein